MPLGTEIGLCPDDIVLDVDTASPAQKRGRAHLCNFGSMSIVAKWLDGSRWHLAWRWALVQAMLLDGDPAPLPEKAAELSSCSLFYVTVFLCF